MPKISIIVPVFMVENELEDCVFSILEQTFSDFELILIDDGSPDKCGEICEQFRQYDTRVGVVHQENKGLSSARNAGLEIAKGDYITFIDSDDVVSKYFLEKTYKLAKNSKAEIVVCEYKSFKDKKELAFKADKENVENSLFMTGKEALLSLYSNKLDRIRVIAWGKLYKKTLFDDLRFPVGKIHEDQNTIPIALYKARGVAWIKEELYGYRIRDNSITRTSFSIKRYDYIEALEHCIGFFKSISETEIEEAATKQKKIIVAYYSLLSRKTGIYHEIPDKYKMGRLRAIQEMRRLLPYDVYTYRLAQIYPNYVSIEAYVRRILQMMGFK